MGIGPCTPGKSYFFCTPLCAQRGHPALGAKEAPWEAQKLQWVAHRLGPLGLLPSPLASLNRGGGVSLPIAPAMPPDLGPWEQRPRASRASDWPAKNHWGRSPEWGGGPADPHPVTPRQQGPGTHRRTSVV